MSQVSKVVKYDLQSDVIELRARGFGVRETAKRLSSKVGKYISHMSVQNYLQSSKDIGIKTVAKEQQLREKLTNQQLDIYQELINVNKIVKKKIEELEDTTQHRDLLGYLKEIRSQSELIAKLLGELTPSGSVSVRQTINLQENIFKTVEELPEE